MESEYAIKISLTKHIHDNPIRPYYWSLITYTTQWVRLSVDGNHLLQPAWKPLLSIIRIISNHNFTILLITCNSVFYKLPHTVLLQSCHIILFFNLLQFNNHTCAVFRDLNQDITVSKFRYPVVKRTLHRFSIELSNSL